MPDTDKVTRRAELTWTSSMADHGQSQIGGRMTTRNFLFPILLIAVLCATAVAAGDFNGTWTAAIDTQVGMQNYTFIFKVAGEKVTGKAKSELAMTETDITEGVVKGDDISFVENLNFQGMPLKITYKGKISGDEIKFTRNVADIADEPFVAKRSK
jgi:hypothetical protein